MSGSEKYTRFSFPNATSGDLADSYNRTGNRTGIRNVKRLGVSALALIAALCVSSQTYAASDSDALVLAPEVSWRAGSPSVDPDSITPAPLAPRTIITPPKANYVPPSAVDAPVVSAPEAAPVATPVEAPAAPVLDAPMAAAPVVPEPGKSYPDGYTALDLKPSPAVTPAAAPSMPEQAIAAPIQDPAAQDTALQTPPAVDAPVTDVPPAADLPATNLPVAEAPAPTDGAAPAPVTDDGTSLAEAATDGTAPIATPETDYIPESDSVFLKRLSGGNGILNLNVSGDLVPDVTEAIQIDEAVAFALKNNYEVKGADEGERGAFWEKMGAYGQYGPAMEMVLSKGRERSRPGSINDANGDRVLDTRHDRRDHDIVIRQPLIDLGIVADILSATDKQEAARLAGRETREGVAFDTVNAFYNIVQARVSIQLADQYKSYLEDIAGRMQTRVDEGGSASADLDRISSRALLAESARVEGIGEYESSIADFKRLTGVTPSELKIPEILAPTVPDDKQDALNAAYKGNPSYLSSLNRIAQAQGDIQKSAAEYLPTVTGQLTNTYAWNAGGAALGNPVDPVFPSQRTSSAILVAKWALHPGTTVPGTMSGFAKKRQMDYEARDNKERIQQGVNASYTALGAATKRKEALSQSVAANMRVVKGFEEQYAEGSRPLFDLLDAYEQLYSSQLNLMRVVIAQARASYQVNKQMGELIPSVIRTSGH